MEQRPLRLGDILDDYCPRERRVTNHAVVAMVEEDVKQTRCTTCDAEHPYKGGREPKRRKKTETAALYREVLADMPEAPTAPAIAQPAAEVESETFEEPLDVPEDAPAIAADAELDPVDGNPVREEGPVHRPLIRATLPRPEGQKVERPIPEFTMRHTGRGGHFRAGGQQRGANGNGNRPHGGRRFGGGHPGGSGRGSQGGFRAQGGQQQQQRQGGRKRSR
jgi:hypothetical protein